MRVVLSGKETSKKGNFALHLSLILCIQGILCSEQCPQGFYGKDCSFKCDCTNSPCHHETGKCRCLDGYIGDRLVTSLLFVKRKKNRTILDFALLFEVFSN